MAETEKMILAAIEGGVNYFDTAYIYPNSEKKLGEVLAKHDKRKYVYIATKLPISMCRKYEDFDRFFNEQLRRLQTDYVDYYFMHNMISLEQWDEVRALGVEKWLAEKKASGQIRHVGFSYHGSGEEFPKVLDSYAWEFCMIQYNYYDENYQAGKKGLLAAAAKGISVMIMEPLLGGRLATGLPQKAIEMFKTADPQRTPAEWALWWLWNQEEVTLLLSGMTSAGQAEANMLSAENFRALTAAELAVFSDVVENFRKSYKVKCTGCNYCLPCPKGIDIPARLAAYNTSYVQNYKAGIFAYMAGMGALSEKPIYARDCNGCGKCEKLCPQNIEIRKELKKVSKRFEPLPIRAVLKLARKFMR